MNTADAQVSALDEPTLDDDGVSDPEISNEDQRDLLVFSTYIGVPRPTPKAERSPESIQGERQFSEIGCEGCHIPELLVRYWCATRLHRSPSTRYGRRFSRRY